MTIENEYDRIGDVCCSRESCVAKFRPHQGYSTFSKKRNATVPGQFCGHECAYRAREAFEADDLGDTPEHLRPLLRVAREIDSNALVYDDGTQEPGVVPSRGRGCCGRSTRVQKPRTRSRS
jgi:hypothetical protein